MIVIQTLISVKIYNLYRIKIVVGTQSHFGRYDCHGKILTDLLSLRGRELVDGCGPGGGG
jgi:hypothetical protein